MYKHRKWWFHRELLGGKTNHIRIDLIGFQVEVRIPRGHDLSGKL